MLEFNTNEDLHTVIRYKRQVERERGHNCIVCVDIDRLAEMHEARCKSKAIRHLTWLGLIKAH